jgi:hypothetical protein
MTSRADKVVTTGNMQTARDPFVDWFKGIMILSVINIHTVYWSGYSYIPEGVRQAALLVDVPIFFFISGYVTRPGSFFFCLLKTIRQFIRLYLHYLLISFLLLFAVFLMTIMLSGWEHADLGPAVVSVFGLSPHGALWDSIWGYNGSLWYVRDYFSLLVFVPFLVGISSLYKIKFNVLVFVLLFTALFPKEYADQRFLFSKYGDVSFYLFFFVLGVIFREQEDQLDTRGLLMSLFLTICLAVVVFYSDNGVLFTDRYKFPPATQYLIYSLPLVHIFALLKKKLRQGAFTFSGRCSLLLRWCGINIYYVYLFQGAVCSLAFFFVQYLVPVFHPAILYGLILSFNILLSLAATYLYVKVKDNVASVRIPRLNF